MRIVVLDFESFFARSFKDDRGRPYSLSNLSTEDYVRHPWFQAHGAAIKWTANTSAQWYDEKHLRFILKQEDWSDTLLIAHHCQFDGLILSHHYDVHPKMLGCTLAMARLLLGNHLSVSLDAVRKHFGMPTKLTPYHLFEGKHWNELPRAVQDEIAAGACDEVESIWKIFGMLLNQGFPREELEVVDLTIRMFTEPCLRADVPLLGRVWSDENTKKQTRMAELGVTSEELQSSDKFAKLLRAEGIEPQKKLGKKKEIYAFAKTDPFMQELQNHEDERIRTLVEARLGAKSTLIQTRAETLGWMARRGPMCVYLFYAGAHTSRWSGGDSTNWQNGVPEINQAVLPPEGWIAARPDAAQIECRLLNCLAGQEDKIEDFRQGRDPYVGVAEAFCGHPVTKEAHPQLRQAGKVVELQAGYGSGEVKIQATLRNKAGIIIDLEEAKQWKLSYRNTHPFVVQLWKTAGRMISRLAGGEPVEWGPTIIKNRKIVLPNGIGLLYDTLEFYKPTSDEDGSEYDRDGYWRLRTRDGWQKMYGAKLVENWIQALARIVISQGMIRISRLGMPVKIVNMRHDDLWLVIRKDGNQQKYLDACKDEMRKTPTWLPGLPLDCEGTLSNKFSK